jgi:biopolymer transport protein ExbD
MARKKFEMAADQELNLAPIMNLVMILIPLLLISVEFEQMGVINVSAPKLSVGPVTDDPTPPEEQPLNLTIAISNSGFGIAATGAKLAPLSGCPEQSPMTVCVKPGKDVPAMLGEVKSLRDKFDATGNRELLVQSDSKLNEVVQAYDFRRLYNELVKIKKNFPAETVVNVGADPDIPFEIVVATMDTVRFKLKGEGDEGTFESDPKFEVAQYQEGSGGDSKYAELFNDVVLAVIQ